MFYENEPHVKYFTAKKKYVSRNKRKKNKLFPNQNPCKSANPFGGPTVTRRPHFSWASI
jgi:hypothetical protein